MKKKIFVTISIVLILTLLVGCASPMKQYEAFVEENEMRDLVDDLMDESEELQELMTESEVANLGDYIYNLNDYDSVDEVFEEVELDEITEKCEDMNEIIEEIDEIMASMEIEDEAVIELNEQLLIGIDDYRALTENTLLAKDAIYNQVDGLCNVIDQLESYDGSTELSDLTNELSEELSPMVEYKLFVEENQISNILSYLENEKQDLEVLTDSDRFDRFDNVVNNSGVYSSVEELQSDLNIQPVIEKCETIVGYSEDIKNKMSTLAINDEQVIALNDKLIEAVESEIEVAESVSEIMGELEYMCLTFYDLGMRFSDANGLLNDNSDGLSSGYSQEILDNMDTINAASEAISNIDFEAMADEDFDVASVNEQKKIIQESINVIGGLDTYNETDTIYNDAFIDMLQVCIDMIDLIIEIVDMSVIEASEEYESFGEYYESINGTYGETIGEWQVTYDSIDIVRGVLETAAKEFDASVESLQGDCTESIEMGSEKIDNWEDDYKDID